MAADPTVFEMEPHFITGSKATKFYNNLQKKLAQITGEASEALFSPRHVERMARDLQKAQGKLHAAYVSGEKELYKLEGKRYQKAAKEAQKIIKIRQSAMKEFKGKAPPSAVENAKSFGEGISGAFGSARSGDAGGVAGYIKKLGLGMKKAGVGAEAKAGIGVGGDVMRSLGGLLKTLGPIVASVGALVGGVAALAKILIDADAAAMEMNKSMIKSGITMADLGANSATLTARFSEVRRSFTDFSNNYKWGTLAKDHIEILSSLNQVGVTFSELTKGLESAEARMNRLQTATATVLTYANLLGMSATEVGSRMGEYMDELGLTLEGVRERFAGLYEAAQTSGFGVKRFMGLLQQASAGMSMYNFRLEEAGALLVKLGKVLGQREGGGFLQTLTKGLQGGVMDRRKQLMLMQGRASGVFERSAESTAGDLMRKMPPEWGQALQRAAEGMKLSLDMSNAKSFARTLGKGTTKQQETLLAKMALEGNDELVRELRKTMGLSRAAGGGLGTQALEASLLDMGGKLAQMLDPAIIGTPLHRMSDVQIAAIESMKGYGQEQINQLRALSENLHGGFKELQRVQKGTGIITKEMEDKLLKAYGATVKETANGRKIVSADGKEIKTLGDHIQANGGELAKITKEKMDEQTKSAMEIAENTRDMATILKQGVEWFLERIYYAVQGIWSWLGGGLSDDDKKERKKALQQVQDEEKDLRRRIHDEASKPESKRNKDLIRSMKASLFIVQRENQALMRSETGGSAQEQREKIRREIRHANADELNNIRGVDPVKAAKRVRETLGEEPLAPMGTSTGSGVSLGDLTGRGHEALNVIPLEPIAPTGRVEPGDITPAATGPQASLVAPSPPANINIITNSGPETVRVIEKAVVAGVIPGVR